MKHLLQKIAAVSLSVLMLVSLNSCGTNKGYAPAKGATWADLCRYFESEWFEALPADVQTQYDNLLLGQSPKKYQDSENEETNSAAIKTEDGEQEYSVFSSDDGIIYASGNQSVEDIPMMMLEVNPEKGAVNYRLSLFCEMQNFETATVLAVRDKTTGEYLAIKAYRSPIDRLYQVADSVQNLKSNHEYLVEAIAIIIPTEGHGVNDVLYCTESITVK